MVRLRTRAQHIKVKLTRTKLTKGKPTKDKHTRVKPTKAKPMLRATPKAKPTPKDRPTTRAMVKGMIKVTARDTIKALSLSANRKEGIHQTDPQLSDKDAAV